MNLSFKNAVVASLSFDETLRRAPTIDNLDGLEVIRLLPMRTLRAWGSVDSISLSIRRLVY